MAIPVIEFRWDRKEEKSEIEKTFSNGKFLAPHALLFKLLREFFEGKNLQHWNVFVSEKERELFIFCESPAGPKNKLLAFLRLVGFEWRKRIREWVKESLEDEWKRCFQIGLLELLFFDKYFLIILFGYLNPKVIHRRAPAWMKKKITSESSWWRALNLSSPV